MRKADVEVQEVICAETGKPMPKIPLWMAGMKVKFVSDEARQKYPSATGIADLEPARRAPAVSPAPDELKELGSADEDIEEDADFEDMDAEPEDLSDEDLES